MPQHRRESARGKLVGKKQIYSPRTVGELCPRIGGLPFDSGEGEGERAPSSRRGVVTFRPPNGRGVVPAFVYCFIVKQALTYSHLLKFPRFSSYL